nr:hypothetical protein BdHM001_18270 [Bdellovibrio sp. HM001]
MTKKDELPHISRRIIQLREARGLSQKDLGALAGVTAPAITMWETGKRFPRGKNLKALAKALGVSEASIMDPDAPETDRSSDRSTLILEIQDLLKSMSQEDLETLKASAENLITLSKSAKSSAAK